MAYSTDYELVALDAGSFEQYDAWIQQLAIRFRNAFGMAQESFAPPDIRPSCEFDDIWATQPDSGLRVAVVAGVDRARDLSAKLVADLCEPRTGMARLLIPNYMPLRAFNPVATKFSDFGIVVQKSEQSRPDEMYGEARQILIRHIEQLSLPA
ncbi:hypothetical protein ABH945_003753 [Paraburkholderia sp. GAS333]|uniref:hypothetical protein n=1 Tax=Paraburkholderia sp. GAS333 TaxID=3156279 RepID=UPI003D19A688